MLACIVTAPLLIILLLVSLQSRDCSRKQVYLHLFEFALFSQIPLLRPVPPIWSHATTPPTSFLAVCSIRGRQHPPATLTC